MIVGVDLGASLGIAILNELSGELVSSYTRESKTDLSARTRNVRRSLFWVVDKYQVNGVSIEEPFSRRTSALGALLPMLGAAVVMCDDVWGVPWSKIKATSLKKFATGKGNADKDAMRVAAEKRWGPLGEDVDDNQVDAMWAAEWYRVNVMFAGVCENTPHGVD